MKKIKRFHMDESFAQVNNLPVNSHSTSSFQAQFLNQAQQQHQYNQSLFISQMSKNSPFQPIKQFDLTPFYGIDSVFSNLLIHHRQQQQQQQQLSNNNNQNNSFILPAMFNQAVKNVINSVNVAKEKQSDESKCHVCGDKATGSHFGGISCESCKAFFRRSVQKSRFQDYKCSYSGECKMTITTRKMCQLCRYNRCLSIGMNPKWVLSDDERHQKYGNRRKVKLSDENLAKSSSSSASCTSNEDQSPESIYSDTYNKAKAQISNNNNNDDDELYETLDQAEIDLVDKLTIGYLFTSRVNKLSNCDENMMSKVFKFADTFSKMIPEFRELDLNDQMSLLLNSCFEMFVCSLVPVYMRMKNDEENVEMLFASSFDQSFLKIFKNEKIVKFLNSMLNLDIDQTSVILILPLVLFASDRPHLVNRKFVYEVQAKYAAILRKYLISKYGGEKCEQIHARLLLKLVELRRFEGLFGSEIV